MTTALLRITSSRAPYRRAGQTFDAPAGKTIGVVTVLLGCLTPALFAELLADPHLDAYVGDGTAWLPLADAGDDVDAIMTRFERFEAPVPITERIAALDAREAELASIRTKLDEHAQSLADRETAVTSREAAAQAHEDDLATATMALGEKTAELNEKRLALEASRATDSTVTVDPAGASGPVDADQHAAATASAKPRAKKLKPATE